MDGKRCTGPRRNMAFGVIASGFLRLDLHGTVLRSPRVLLACVAGPAPLRRPVIARAFSFATHVALLLPSLRVWLHGDEHGDELRPRAGEHISLRRGRASSPSRLFNIGCHRSPRGLPLRCALRQAHLWRRRTAGDIRHTSRAHGIRSTYDGADLCPIEALLICVRLPRS